MVNVSEYIGKRVTFLINARAYDTFNASYDSPTSLVLVAKVISQDESEVVVEDVECRSLGLFLTSSEADDGDEGIRPHSGRIDKRFIILAFDKFDEVTEED